MGYTSRKYTRERLSITPFTQDRSVSRIWVGKTSSGDPRFLIFLFSRLTTFVCALLLVSLTQIYINAWRQTFPLWGHVDSKIWLRKSDQRLLEKRLTALTPENYWWLCCRFPRLGGSDRKAINKRIRELEKDLELWKTKVIAFATNQLEFYLEQQIIIWKQRSKHHCHQERDRNTPSFYTYASYRCKKNHIFQPKDENDNLKIQKTDLERSLSPSLASSFTQPTLMTLIFNIRIPHLCMRRSKTLSLAKRSDCTKINASVYISRSWWYESYFFL